jgi:hypothetical protein
MATFVEWWADLVGIHAPYSEQFATAIIAGGGKLLLTLLALVLATHAILLYLERTLQK